MSGRPPFMDASQQNQTKTKERVRPALPAHVLVFIEGFCLMVVELIAGRIMAPYLGVSLYTWTSVIGVVLLGITVGNFCGGILAEKYHADRRIIGYIFFLSGVVAAASVYVFEPVYLMVSVLGLPQQASALLFSLLGFFPTSFLLSLITPIVIANSLKSLERTGTTVGGIYAISSVASILGTFATGFFLIAWFGVNFLMLSVAAVLALTGIYTAAEPRLTRSSLSVLILGLLWGGLLLPGRCETETAYYCVRAESVQRTDLGQGLALRLDYLVHSYVFDRSSKLGYDYELVYADASEYAAARLPDRKLSALFIGGGGYTMPRYLAELYPGSRMDVAEIDPGVTKYVEDRLGLNPEDPDIRTYNGDARMFLARDAGGRRYDLIFGDAFNDYSVPYHLTTLEFARMVKEHLAPGGIYALNIIDKAGDGRLTASFIKTLSGVFPSVELMNTDLDWTRGGRDTYVILASDRLFNADEWRSAADAAHELRLKAGNPSPQVLAQRLAPADIERYFDPDKGVLLTDDYAPTDALTTSLFRSGR